MELAGSLDSLNSSFSWLLSVTSPVVEEARFKDLLGCSNSGLQNHHLLRLLLRFLGKLQRGGTLLKLVLSSMRGSKALFIYVIILLRRRWLIRALASSRNLIAAPTVAIVCSEVPSGISVIHVVPNGAKAFSTASGELPALYQ